MGKRKQRSGFITDCDANGNRFNPNKVLYDPYGKEMSP
jgi:glycogen operon protein